MYLDTFTFAYVDGLEQATIEKNHIHFNECRRYFSFCEDEVVYVLYVVLDTLPDAIYDPFPTR